MKDPNCQAASKRKENRKFKGIHISMKFLILSICFNLCTVIKSQSLDYGINKFLYSSTLHKNKFLLQSIYKESDSFYSVKSTVVILKDSCAIKLLYEAYFDSILNINFLPIEIQSNRDIKTDVLYISNRQHMPTNSVIYSKKNNFKIVNFYDNYIYKETEIIFDLVELRAIKRDSLNNIAEFSSANWFLGFNRYVFLKDFWVIKYLNYSFEPDQFVLISYNSNVFDPQAWLDKIKK